MKLVTVILKYVIIAGETKMNKEDIYTTKIEHYLFDANKRFEQNISPKRRKKCHYCVVFKYTINN